MQKPSAITSGTLQALIIILTLATSLAGCGNSAMSSAAGYFREGILGGPDLAMSRADVLNIPYASIAVRLGRGPQAFVVLASQTNHIQHWVAADNHLIETQNGRITRTIGFDQDLTHTSFLNPDPLQAHLDPTKTYTLDRIIDLTDHTPPTGDSPADGLLVHATLTCQGPQTLTIIGVKTNTFLWAEKFTAPDIKWSQTNKYWQDQQTKTIWKSQQYIDPKLPKIETITLRRYVGE
jgi:hypothetical protein